MDFNEMQSMKALEDREKAFAELALDQVRERNAEPRRELPDISKFLTPDKPVSQTIVNVGENGIANIIGGDVNSSVVGNSGNVSYDASVTKIRQRIKTECGADAEILSEMIDLLENVLNGKVTPKKGLFAKFSDAMERHSWISGAVASTLLSWLTSFVPFVP